MNVAADVLPAAKPPERADLAAWLAVAAGTLAAFMALLDISIVNAALPTIQGEIGATPSEGTWVNTSYIVAEIVIMPLTAWLERLFGLRKVLLFGASIFTVFSVVCGLSGDLTTMVLGRIGQGLAGGVMIPTGMTIMAKRLPPRQQSIGMAIFASAALLGPIIGPLLGGWITENFSWHYSFFINVPICAGLVLLIVAGLPKEPGNLREIANADWFGVFGMMVGLGCATVLLEEGHREQWFDSSFIWKLAIASVTGFILVAIGQFRSKTPVLKLALLRDLAFSGVILLMMVTGMVLFSTLFVVPQFLAAIAGYNAMQAGQVLFASAVVSITGALIYPILISRIDIRALVGCAFLLTAMASFMASQVTSETVGSHFIVALMILGLGSTLSAIPLQQAALTVVPVEDSGQATSMFNIGRNIGASIGLASLASLLESRIEFHHWRLNEQLPANDPAVHERLAELGAITGGGPSGMDSAYRMLDGLIMREALVMSFSDIFTALALASLLAAPLVLLLKPIDPARAKGMSH